MCTSPRSRLSSGFQLEPFYDEDWENSLTIKKTEGLLCRVHNKKIRLVELVRFQRKVKEEDTSYPNLLAFVNIPEQQGASLHTTTVVFPCQI